MIMECFSVCSALAVIVLFFLVLSRFVTLHPIPAAVCAIPGPPKRWLIGSIGVFLSHGELYGWKKAIGKTFTR